MERRKSAIAILAAGCMWGSSNLYMRTLVNLFGLSPIGIFFAKISLSFVMYTIFIAIKDPSKFKIHPKDFWMVAGSGLLGVGFLNFCYFTLMAESASAASVFIGSAPVFVMIFSVFLFKETFTVSKAISLALTIGGCILTSGIIGSAEPLGIGLILIGVGTSLCKASYTIFSRYARQKYDALTVTWYSFGLAFLLTIPFGDIPKTIPTVFSDWRAFLLSLALAFIGTIFPYFLYSYGLKNTKPGRSIMLAATEPLVGCILGMTVWGEYAPLKVVGVVMILISLCILGSQGMKNKNKKKTEYDEN